MSCKLTENKQLFVDSRLTILPGWILDDWCQADSGLYYFDNTTGQLTVKRDGFYWCYGHVSNVVKKYLLHRHCGPMSDHRLYLKRLCKNEGIFVLS